MSVSLLCDLICLIMVCYIVALTASQPRSRVYLFNGGIWTEARQEPQVQEEDDSREEDEEDIREEKEDSKVDKDIREEEKDDIRENGTVDRKDSEGCRQDVVEKRSVEQASILPTHSDSQHSDIVLPTAKRKKP